MPKDLIDIKKESSESSAMCCPDNENYPYGTRIDFSDEMVDLLGADKLAVGDVIEVRALAYIASKSEHESEDHSSKNISLQLTAVGLDAPGESRVNKLYGDGDDK